MLYRKQIKIKTANKREISIAAQILVEQIARIICAAVGNSDGVLMCVCVMLNRALVDRFRCVCLNEVTKQCRVYHTAHTPK